MTGLVFGGGSAAGAAEADAYEALIITAGGTLSATQKAAAAVFVARGKAVGWWDKVVDCGLFLGSNVDAAMVKIKAAPGAGTSYVNHNFVSGDYTVAGALVSADDAKWLGTDVVPADQGLSITNISYGVGVLDPQEVGNGIGLFGDNPGSGNSVIGGLEFAAMGNSNDGFAWQKSYSAAISYGAAAQHGAMDGIGVRANTYNNSSGTADTEVTIFQLTTFGTLRHGIGTIGFFFIGSELTYAELRSITAEARRCHKTARDPTYGLFTDVVMGDSISCGQFTWPNTVTDSLGANLLNISAGSTKMSYEEGGASAGINRYQGIETFPVDTVFCSLGINEMGNSDTSENGDPAKIAVYKDNLITFANDNKTLSRVVLVGISWTASVTQTKLLAWVDALLDAASETGVIGVDIARPMIDAGVVDNPLMFFDSGQGPGYIHPNGDGHTFMAGIIEAAL